MSKLLLAVAAGALLAGATIADAANFSFTGHFTADDNVQLFNFTISATSTVTAKT